MPPFNHLHPLIVHFPIALLMFAPALVVLGLLWPAQRMGIHLAALADLAAGALSALAAVVTGNAASGLAQRTPELRLALAAHEHYAELTAAGFGVLTVIFAGIWWLARVAPETWGRGRQTLLVGLWLALCLGWLPMLVRTGSLGGRMVHELGTHPVIVRDTPQP